VFKEPKGKAAQAADTALDDNPGARVQRRYPGCQKVFKRLSGN
jgi:hypothetical protein